VDVEAIQRLLGEFVRQHRAAFSQVSERESQLLELGAIVAVERHYSSNGFLTRPVAPSGGDGRTFVVKSGTRGHPARYSRVIATKDADTVELHMNLMVRGAHDVGIYCVDVGVVRAGVIPETARRSDKWACVENSSLVTFAEVKRLVVYPMLLAQFVGIVHEIKPACLKPPSPKHLGRFEHLPPALLALGHFSGNSLAIVQGFKARGFTVCIAEGLDLRIAAHRKGTSKSPLYWDSDSERREGHGEAEFSEAIGGAERRRSARERRRLQGGRGQVE
jgi:hypothetical protein